MTLKALKNHILFKFLDPVNSKGEFVRAKTDFGLEFLSGVQDSSKSPRWAEVIAVGPEVEHVQPGNVILLPALRWTIGTKHEGERFWRTDEKQVVCVRPSTDKDAGFKPMNSFVMFKPIPKEVKQYSGLIVVGDVEGDNPAGQIFSIGPDVCEELHFCKFYYSDANFFNHVHNDDKRLPFPFSFINEEDILVFEPRE